MEDKLQGLIGKPKDGSTHLNRSAKDFATANNIFLLSDKCVATDENQQNPHHPSHPRVREEA